jgi:hypothetical protein
MLIGKKDGFFYLTPTLKDMNTMDETDTYRHVWMSFEQNPAVREYVHRPLDMANDVLLWFRENDGINMAYLL